MDISVFSSDDFDTKDWVNQVLKNAENQEKKESYTLSIVMKLQLYVQQVNSALEETSQQVLQSFPNIIRNTKYLQDEAVALKQKMVAVYKEINDVENETGKSINTIEKLDNIITQLSISKQSLHESDNWSLFVQDLEDVFDSNDVKNISEKILGMQQSLKLLVNISDYESKKMQLDGLKNRLEAIASPQIVQAFTSNNNDQAMFYVKMFSKMERLPQLIKYYDKCQKDLLLKKWQSITETDQDDSLIQWMQNFYDYLISNWYSQYKWFNQVFNTESPTDILVKIYIGVLLSLNPSIDECIEASLKQVTDKLNFIYEIKQIIQQFASRLVNVITQTIQNTLEHDDLKVLLQAIFNPLINQIHKYQKYQESYLLKKLSPINCIKDEPSETVQSLILSVPTVMGIAEEAKKQCAEITENCGYCGLLMALRTLFVTYIDQYKSALRQIENSRKNAEDWQNFQISLSLLQNVGEVLLKIKDFEKELADTVLVDINKKQESIEFKYLLLNQEDRREFNSLVKCVTEGTKLCLLDHVLNEYGALCSNIYNVVYQIVFSPIATHLNVVQLPKTWEQFSNSTFHFSNMPDFSFSPQEYITQIGQYLMTLPQHLEPFFFRDNPSLTCALKVVDEEYNLENDVDGALATVFLKLLVKGICHAYCDSILSIRQLSQPASKQLAHDIGYLRDRKSVV